jgi:hypothetical protein
MGELWGRNLIRVKAVVQVLEQACAVFNVKVEQGHGASTSGMAFQEPGDGGINRGGPGQVERLREIPDLQRIETADGPRRAQGVSSGGQQ